MTKLIEQRIEEPKLPEVLRLVSGAESTLLEAYRKRIIVTIKAIGTLHKQIIDKLALHKVVQVQFSATVTFKENSRTRQFKDIIAFLNNDWNRPETTESLILKWHFFTDVGGLDDEKLHTITVRFADMLNPAQWFQKIMSNDHESFDKAEVFSPMSCKVDFADNTFAREILNVAATWNKSQPEPEPMFRSLSQVSQKADLVKAVVGRSFPFITLLAYSAACIHFARPTSITSATNDYVFKIMLWAVGFFVLFSMSRVIGSALAGALHNNLSRITRFPIFQITDGDNTRFNQASARSNGAVWKFIGYGLVTVFWKVIAGGVTIFLFPK